MIDLEPVTILDYPLHWLPLLLEIMESQWTFHQTNLDPDLTSAYAEWKKCASSYERDRKEEKRLIWLLSVYDLLDTTWWLLRIILWPK